MTDAITILGTALGGTGLGAVVARYAVPAIASVIRHREKNRTQVAVSEAEARATERVAREEGAAAVVSELLDEVREMRGVQRELRAEVDECREHRDTCREELRETRAHVGRLADRLAEVIREGSGETTGLHEVLEIAASNTPIPGPPPLPRETTMLPPPGGEEE